MKTKLFLVALFLAVVGLLPASVFAQEDLPVWGDLPAGEWTMIPTGGETICSNGDPYAFFVRPAAQQSEKLLIHFQGGGACWFGAICDLQTNPTYDPNIDEMDNPANYDGIFNFKNAENPFSDYNMVFVPYCTGDVLIGNKDTTYAVKRGDENGEIIIHHRGYVNTTTVLDWTYENVINPETVFVTGCSAGAIPAPFYTQFVAEAYPDARIEELGDAAGSYRNPILAETVFTQWGTVDALPENYSDEAVDTLTFEDFYSHTAAMFPNISLTEYNTAEDEVQAGFLQISGLAGVSMKDLQEANFEDILASGEDVDFHTFTAGGKSHCITPTADFYTYSVNGMSFRDWMAALAAGEEVETIACTECDAPELIEPMSGTTSPDMSTAEPDAVEPMATAEATSAP
jgi:hypothetical protein